MQSSVFPSQHTEVSMNIDCLFLSLSIYYPSPSENLAHIFTSASIDDTIFYSLNRIIAKVLGFIYFVTLSCCGFFPLIKKVFDVKNTIIFPWFSFKKLLAQCMLHSSLLFFFFFFSLERAQSHTIDTTKLIYNSISQQNLKCSRWNWPDELAYFGAHFFVCTD